MKKNTYFFKQLTCLLAFLFLGIISVISTYGLRSATITSFPPSDFWVVDHTTPGYSLASYPENTIVGYKFVVETTPNFPKNRKYYQLTDTIPNMTVAIGNKNKIDLNRNGEFDLRLFFDTGSYGDNANIPVGNKNRRVSEGICFVLHSKDTSQNLIGGDMGYLGYAGIRPSFAVEFDTEHNGTEGVGADYDINTSNHHISYLKGNVSALPGTYKPMQNNGANVGVGDGFNVKIVGRKGYANNTPYYDLLTYMEEKDTLDPQGGELLLRDSMRFNSLSEVIAGLEIDENCQALVTGGITSATCGIANRHAVEFVKLEAAKKIIPSLTAVVERDCEGSYYRRYPQLTQFDSVLLSMPPGPHYYAQLDTILQPVDITDCYSSNNPSPTNDTIEYTISCADVRADFYCDYFLGFTGIPDYAECKYYLNDSLVYSNIPGNIVYGNDVFQDWFEFNYKYFDNDLTSNIKIVINDAEYNFKISLENNTIKGIKQLTQTTDIKLDPANSRFSALELNSTTLAQSIQLPTLAGCQNINLSLESVDSLFVIPPTIDSNNVLTFELKPRVCSAYVYMTLQCECDEGFALLIANTGCNDYLCDLIHIGEIYREAAPVSSNGRTRLPGMRIMYEVGIEDQDNHGRFIDTTVATELATDAPDISFIDKVFMKPFGNNALEITFLGCDGEYIYKKYEICATLDNGISCCDTFEFHDTCHGIHSGIELNSTTAGVIDYELAHSEHYQPGGDIQPIPPVYGILEVYIYDFTGTLLQSMNAGYVAEGDSGTIYYNTTFYPIGYAVFLGNDKIKAIKLLNN